MMKKLVHLSFLIALSSCASLVNDNPQIVKITASNGQEIKGVVQRDKLTTTKEGKKTIKNHSKITELNFRGVQNSVMIERSSASKTIVVENPECVKETPVERYISPAFYFNVLIGGVLGSLTDAGTEKMWRYRKNIVIDCQQPITSFKIDTQ